MYVSLALGIEHLARVDPPMDNATRCYHYTSSDDEESRPAPTTNDRVADKRPMARESSRAGAALAESAQGPSTRQGSASGARVPKRRRLLRVIHHDDEEEEAAPTLVRKPRSRPEVVLVEGGRASEDMPTVHAPAEQARPDKAEIGG